MFDSSNFEMFNVWDGTYWWFFFKLLQIGRQPISALPMTIFISIAFLLFKQIAAKHVCMLLLLEFRVRFATHGPKLFLPVTVWPPVARMLIFDLRAFWKEKKTRFEWWQITEMLWQIFKSKVTVLNIFHRFLLLLQLASVWPVCGLPYALNLFLTWFFRRKFLTHGLLPPLLLSVFDFFASNRPSRVLPVTALMRIARRLVFDIFTFSPQSWLQNIIVKNNFAFLFFFLLS